MSGEPERRFADALAKAREEWAAADAAACAARAGGEWADGVVRVPLFGRPHVVTHPGGEVLAAPDEPVHVAVGILLLHYLLAADGTPPAGAWSAYRELPDGLFYAASFAQRAEQPLARAFAGVGRRPRRVPRGRARGRRRRAHAGRRVVPLRRPAARGRRRAGLGRRRRGAGGGPRAVRRQRGPLPAGRGPRRPRRPARAPAGRRRVAAEPSRRRRRASPARADAPGPPSPGTFPVFHHDDKEAFHVRPDRSVRGRDHRPDRGGGRAHPPRPRGGAAGRGQPRGTRRSSRCSPAGSRCWSTASGEPVAVLVYAETEEQARRDRPDHGRHVAVQRRVGPARVGRALRGVPRRGARARAGRLRRSGGGGAPRAPRPRRVSRPARRRDHSAGVGAGLGRPPARAR